SATSIGNPRRMASIDDLPMMSPKLASVYWPDCRAVSVVVSRSEPPHASQTQEQHQHGYDDPLLAIEAAGRAGHVINHLPNLSGHRSSLRQCATSGLQVTRTNLAYAVWPAGSRAAELS